MVNLVTWMFASLAFVFFCFFGKLGGDAPEIAFLMILQNRLWFLFFWQVGWGCPRNSFSDDSVESTLFFVFLASWVGMPKFYGKQTNNILFDI
jgi:hypothetical protein